MARPRVKLSGPLGEIDVSFAAIENGGRDREIAVGGVAVGNRADMRIDAEDLLDDADDAARGAVGPRAKRRVRSRRSLSA